MRKRTVTNEDIPRIPRQSYLGGEVAHVERGHGVVGAGLLAGGRPGRRGLLLLLLHRCCHFHLVATKYNFFLMVGWLTGRVLVSNCFGIF